MALAYIINLLQIIWAPWHLIQATYPTQLIYYESQFGGLKISLRMLFWLFCLLYM